MRCLVLVAASLAVGGCNSPADDLDKQYEIMSRAGASAGELCAQSRKVVAAILEDRDEERYKERKLRSDIECQAARLDDASSS